jgi:hypothetical protein
LHLIFGHKLQAADAFSHGHGADFTFLDTKGFLTDAASLCQIAYKEDDELTAECKRFLERRTHLDMDSIHPFGGDVAGGVTANFELKGVVYKLVAFMGTKGWLEQLNYVPEAHTFPYIPVDDILKFKTSVFGHKSPRFGIVSNFWENYTASEWTRDSAEGETPLIFMGHSRGGAVADIAAWHTATFRGIET